MDLFSMFHLLARTPSHSSSFIARHYLHTFCTGYCSTQLFFYLPLILILMFPSHCCNVFSPFSTFSFALFSVSINAPFCGRFLWQGMRHEATIFSSLILATDLQDILKINFIFIKGVSLSLSLSKVQKTYFIWGGVGGSDHLFYFSNAIL